MAVSNKGLSDDNAMHLAAITSDVMSSLVSQFSMLDESSLVGVLSTIAEARGN